MVHDILIVDDEADIRLLLSGILEDEGYATREAMDADSALARIGDRVPHLIILDIWLEESRLDGLQLLREIKHDHPNVPVVMISGHGNIETAVSTIKSGAYDFIEKPFESERLLLIVERAMEAARLRRENQELRRHQSNTGEMYGCSPAIVQMRQAIDRVAPSSSRILITGPAGSGKEVVARIIHAKSKRAMAPLVVVNCAAMHPDRMEIELFGRERALAGDDEPRKVGLLEQADGGTLLLDEVSDMPLETQGKIVRVLQEQMFERVGGVHRLAVDVRVVATTAQNLQDLMGKGTFREDLFYRLNVVPLRMPALRARREDIPVLAEAFMERAAQTAGTSPRPLGDDAMAALQSYDWPGNVRQLKNVIEWVLIMAPGDSREAIRADMLPAEIGSITPEILRLERSGEIMALPIRGAREMFEREYLLAQVTRFNGNVSRTAEFVGMERSALHRKLKLLGVTGEGRGNT